MLSRQQIRERKRHLQKEENQKRKQALTLAELNEQERLHEQKRNGRDQMALQTGSLCVALLAQVPEKRDGVDGIATKAIDFLDSLISRQQTQLTAADEPEEEEPEEDDDEDEDALAEAS